MILKMKKFTFLVTHGEYDKFINDIRQLGIIHVEELQRGTTSEELQRGLSMAERYKKALQALDVAYHTYGRGRKKYEQLVEQQAQAGNLTAKEISLLETVQERRKALKTKSQLGDKIITDEFTEKTADVTRAVVVLEQVERLLAEENDINHQIDSVLSAIRKLENWGEIDWDSLRRIEAQGYKVGFFRCNGKSFKAEWANDYFATEISSDKKQMYFVTFSEEVPTLVGAERIQLPQTPLSDFYAQEGKLLTRLNAIHLELCRIHGEEQPTLLAGQLATENDISLSKVHLSNESMADGVVKLMVGWAPEENADKVVDYLEKERIFYEMEDPAFDDDVPIEIRNDKFSSLFEPILKMYSLPNYHDIDPLPFFAPFFMLFFGLCMGDMGYGLIILFGGLALMRCKPSMASYGKLGAFLGGMTCICGFLTGSFFGIDLATVDWDFMKPIQPYFLNDSKKDSFFGYSPMMVISVIIGLIQVLLGMTLAGCKAVKNYGIIYGVGKFSWVLALLSATVLFGFPLFGVELSIPVQCVLYALIALSAFGIFFLNNPNAYKKDTVLGKALGVGSNVGAGIWATYGMSTGLLGDLLSYIRLFALGLTGGVLGSVFNTLAVEMSPSIPVAHELTMLIILLIGHSINFALCMISSFVHPMRLTFVEYFKNADFEGNGKKYQPFRIKR